jgi:DNA-binding Lrp family transcriptional regulator
MTYHSASKGFNGSITYLEQFANGASRQGVLNALKNLLRRGYIKKFAAEDKINRFIYRAKLPADIFAALEEAKAEKKEKAKSKSPRNRNYMQRKYASSELEQKLGPEDFYADVI